MTLSLSLVYARTPRVPLPSPLAHACNPRGIVIRADCMLAERRLGARAARRRE